MALFGKKKAAPADDLAAGSPQGEPEGNGQSASPTNPAKADSFYRHARAMHDASNYEYAITLWLQGLRQDPTSMTGMESFYESCEAFISTRGKFGPTKDQLKSFNGKGDVEQLLLALLNWGTRPLDAGVGLRAIEAMNKLDRFDLGEQMHWVGEKVLAFSRRGKKPKKETFVKMMRLFTSAGVFDLAVKAGETALELDPTDGVIQTEVRNLSAQATMTTGGYDQTGQAGGFRKNILNTEAQRRLEEEERIVKTEDVVERIINDARADYESRPDDAASVQKYARALLERGSAADEKTALAILTKAYEATQEFRFRQQAGEIRIRQGRRKVAALQQRAQAAPDNAEAQALASKGARALLKLEAQEYQLRIDAFPTDLSHKFELGRRLYDLGKFEDAIQLFQQARNEPKRRAQCLSYLGQAFLKLGWRDEAIETLRSAVESHEDLSDEMGKDLRYGLMSALELKAQDENDLACAEEAARFASGIAVEQINFRDIRDRRAALQELVKGLRAAATS